MPTLCWAEEGGSAGCCAVLVGRESFVLLQVAKQGQVLGLSLTADEARKLGMSLMADAAELDRLPPGLMSGEG